MLYLMPDESSQRQRVSDLMEERFGWNKLARGLLTPPPIDISRPNIHETKEEFQKELKVVTEVVENINAVLLALIPKDIQADEMHKDLLVRLNDAISQSARTRASIVTPETLEGLAVDCAVSAGFFHTSISMLFELKSCYKSRLDDLKAQEEEFWSQSHRPPNHYARAIALRLARFVASQTKKKPTVGTSRDGPYPSTDFGRAVEEVFAILEIDANFKRPAEWAISQLTEEDWKPTRNALNFDYGGGIRMGHKTAIANALLAHSQKKQQK